MRKNTRVTEKLKIAYPIIQGPFGGGISSVALASAVSNAGGLGSFGAHHLGKTQILETAQAIREKTTKSFALNLWIPAQEELGEKLSESDFEKAISILEPYYDELKISRPKLSDVIFPKYEEQIEAILEAKPAAFSFVFGIPSREIIAECKKRQIVTMGAATHVDEAVAIEAAGIDIIVASGSEAGGHRVSFLSDPEESPALSALIPQIVDRVKIPVIAAGGIADGRGIVSAFTFGAEGVQVGTAFLACDESNASAAHRAELRKESARFTALTKVFSGRYARGIKNRFMTELKKHESEIAPYPYQNWLTQLIRRNAAQAGKSEYLGLWAGQNAPLIKHTKAEELVRFLVEDAERVRKLI